MARAALAMIEPNKLPKKSTRHNIEINYKKEIPCNKAVEKKTLEKINSWVSSWARGHVT